jgi:hypothetical protein
MSASHGLPPSRTATGTATRDERPRVRPDEYGRRALVTCGNGTSAYSHERLLVAGGQGVAGSNPVGRQRNRRSGAGRPESSGPFSAPLRVGQGVQRMRRHASTHKKPPGQRRACDYFCRPVVGVRHLERQRRPGPRLVRERGSGAEFRKPQGTSAIAPQRRVLPAASTATGTATGDSREALGTVPAPVGSLICRTGAVPSQGRWACRQCATRSRVILWLGSSMPAVSASLAPAGVAS